jgi:hypothetical protein
MPQSFTLVLPDISGGSTETPCNHWENAATREALSGPPAAIREPDPARRRRLLLDGRKPAERPPVARLSAPPAADQQSYPFELFFQNADGHRRSAVSI